MAVPLAASEAASESLRQDAASYAEQFGVDLDEAIRRLQLQRAAGDLDAALAAEEPESFAGLWIEHAPSYRMVARFTNRAAEARLKARIAGGPLAGLVETRGARWSLAQLEAKQLALKERLKKAQEAEYSSDLNVFENRIDLHTTDPERTQRKLAAARLSLPEGVRAERVSRLGERQALVGGTPGTNCTLGFPVVAASGELGIATAGHCNAQNYQGRRLPLRNEREGGDYDVQWHSTCDLFDVTNQIDSGIGLRSIHSTRSRSQMTIGTFLCKMGMVTGRTCGTISSKNHDPGEKYNPTFIRVEGGYTNLSDLGDSGGPWFVEDVAYGQHYGEYGSDGHDAVFSPINTIVILGVSVLTYDPGPGCFLQPVASFTYGNTAMQYTFDASASYDPDGSVVSYFWSFGDGTTATTSTPSVSHVYDGGSFTVTLTVTDNEGLTGSTSTEITTCGGPWQPVCFD